MTEDLSRELVPDEPGALSASSRLAARMLAERTTAPYKGARAPRTIRVGGDGADFEEIQTALAAARDGDRIRVSPGAYAAPLVMKVSVEIIGDGHPGAAVVEWSDTSVPALLIDTERGLIKNLTIAGPGHAEDGLGHQCAAIEVASGKIEVQDLIVRGSPGYALYASSKRAFPLVRRSRFEGAWAARFDAASGGLMEDFEFRGACGLTVSGSQTDPVVRRATIEATNWAVYVEDEGTVRIEDSVLTLKSGVEHEAAVRVYGNHARAIIVNSTVSTGQWQVGALAVSGGSLHLERSQILGQGSKWGVAFESTVADSQVVDSVIRGHALGVMYDAQGPVILRGNTIEDCGTALVLEQREDRQDADVMAVANRLLADRPVSAYADALFLSRQGFLTGDLALGPFRFQGNDFGARADWLHVLGTSAASLLGASPEPGRRTIGTFHVGELADALRRVAPAASASAHWKAPALGCVRMQIDEHRCDLVAADNRRLALDTIAVERRNHEQAELLVPKAAALMLADKLSGTDDRVTLDVAQVPQPGSKEPTRQLLVFTWSAGSVVSRAGTGPFPDIMPVLQRHRPVAVASVEAGSLRDLLPTDEGWVELVLGPAATVPPISSSADSIAVTTADGSQASIVVIGRLLADALRPHGSSIVTLEASADGGPLAIRCGSSVCLIMPRRQ